MFWKNNGLSIVLLALFLLSFGGQAVTGWWDSNDDARQHGQPQQGFAGYLASGHFWEATGENWESEFLQMAAFVLLTVFLRQKGSAESKRIDVIEDVDLDPRDHATGPDVPSAVRRGGLILRLYEHSLGITFASLFVISVTIHAVGGVTHYNEEQQAHGQPRITLAEYVASSRFWFESFQNWQSEFLSLAGMVIGTIYLRQRGSAESKPVFAPHAETGR
jgi:hypothetical protein